MNALRRRLIGFASAWLCAQMIALAAAPISLCATDTASKTPAACSCAHVAGDNASCPMHRHPASPASAAGCHCRGNTPDPAGAAVATMFGPAGVLTGASSAPAPRPSSALPSLAPSIFESWIAVPDGPPPRL